MTRKYSLLSVEQWLCYLEKLSVALSLRFLCIHCAILGAVDLFFVTHLYVRYDDSHVWMPVAG